MIQVLTFQKKHRHMNADKCVQANCMKNHQVEFKQSCYLRLNRYVCVCVYTVTTCVYVPVCVAGVRGG